MTDRPEPLTPPECDLRGYDYMPLHGHKLFGSTLDIESTDAEFRAAIRLWWAAWNQKPAASLPAADHALAQLAGYGRDVKGWSKVKSMALHGFVECADGRLYHPLLSDLAVHSYELRLRDNAKREADRDRLRAWRETRKKRGGNDGGTTPETQSETRFNTSTETQSETSSVAVEGKVREGKGSLRSPPARARALDLPPWLPIEAWNGFVEMRKRIRKPLTERAVTLILGQLDAFRTRGLDVEASLNQSVASSWAGVFEPKVSRTASRRQQATDAWDQVGDFLDRTGGLHS